MSSSSRQYGTVGAAAGAAIPDAGNPRTWPRFLPGPREGAFPGTGPVPRVADSPERPIDSPYKRGTFVARIPYFDPENAPERTLQALQGKRQINIFRLIAQSDSR